MARTYTRKNVTIAALKFALGEKPEVDLDDDAAEKVLRDVLRDMQTPKPVAPSVETLRNRRNKDILATWVASNPGEYTARELTDKVKDCDGLPMPSRKIGMLMRELAAEGRVAISPEGHTIAHYGPIGYKFEKRWDRRTKAYKQHVAAASAAA